MGVGGNKQLGRGGGGGGEKGAEDTARLQAAAAPLTPARPARCWASAHARGASACPGSVRQGGGGAPPPRAAAWRGPPQSCGSGPKSRCGLQGWVVASWVGWWAWLVAGAESWSGVAWRVLAGASLVLRTQAVGRRGRGGEARQLAQSPSRCCRCRRAPKPALSSTPPLRLPGPAHPWACAAAGGCRRGAQT